MAVKVLMYGWEFPPYNSGGLGVACQGIVENLLEHGLEVDFVLPKKVNLIYKKVNFLYADTETILTQKQLTEFYSGYHTFETYQNLIQKIENKTIPLGKSLHDEVIKYSILGRRFAEKKDFDVIHCHDWLTILAGIEARKISGKPLVFHIHATEYERTGGNYNHLIYEVEKYGMQEATQIVTVSEFTKQKIIEHYQIPSEKIEVVHNGIDFESEKSKVQLADVEKLQVFKKTGHKIVLYVGRLTFQKGIEYLLQAVKMAVQYDPQILFVIAGSGDMENWLLQEIAKMGISDKVIFTGFLRGSELASMYALADLYVMPSRYEPFGLVALEALVHETPVIVSKNSGVSEVITNALKVDYWDSEEMANLIYATLNYEALHQTLKNFSFEEVKKITWKEAAKKLIKIYQAILE